MKKAAMVLQVLLGLAFLGAAIPKLVGAQERVKTPSRVFCTVGEQSCKDLSVTELIRQD